MRLSAHRRGDEAWSSEFPTARRRQVRLRESVIEVTRLGRGTPIVLVPGLAGDWKLLAPLARRLARHHEVILYGLRGDRSAPGMRRAKGLSDYAGDLGALIGALGLERPIVFGVSFGGAVALEFAAEDPQRVGGLILSGVEARFRAVLGARIARTTLERFPLPADNRFVNQFFNLLHAGKPEPGPLVDFIVRRCWETDQAVIAHRLALLEDFDIEDRLWRIDAPTLVLAGTRDAIVAPSRQRALADAIGGARYVALEGAGHVGFLTHRAEIARQVAGLAEAVRTPC